MTTVTAVPARTITPGTIFATATAPRARYVAQQVAQRADGTTAVDVLPATRHAEGVGTIVLARGQHVLTSGYMAPGRPIKPSAPAAENTTMTTSQSTYPRTADTDLTRALPGDVVLLCGCHQTVATVATATARIGRSDYAVTVVTTTNGTRVEILRGL